MNDRVDRQVAHATFTIERVYPVEPARVFGAWSDPVSKRQWFAGDARGWTNADHDLDFRVGGREHNSARPADGGDAHVYDAIYLDIVDGNRIIYAYEMHLGAARISASLATVEFRAEGDQTRLRFTEQGAFLDAYDDPAQRERGTESLLDALGTSLDQEQSLRTI